MKKIVRLISLIILIITLNSCKKNSVELPQNTHEDAYGDIILKKMNMQGNIKYVLVSFAGGNQIIENGSFVITPGGLKIDLHEFWAGPGKLTGTTAPSNIKPEPGTYTFTLKFKDGYVKTITDILEPTEIDVPVISVNYNKTAQTISIQWDPIAGADLYCVKLTELDIANTKPLFKVAQVSPSQNSFTIHIDGSNGWLRPVSDLQDGVQYWVVVAAKKVEQGKPVSGMSQDFQTSSCQKTKITF